MKIDKTLKSPLDLHNSAKKLGKKVISNSQIKSYTQCPHKWKLMYIDGKKEYTPSIFFVFGTAVHETMQNFLEVMYNSSAKLAESMNLPLMLKNNMGSAYKTSLKRSKGKQFTTKYDMEDIYKDGLEIFKAFLKKRGIYFKKKNTELLGIEVPLFVESESNENVMIGGFIDLVMREGDKIKIYDIKTSYKTWDKKKKKDSSFQLRLYKKYFSKQYDVREDDIEIEFFILKRKIYENSDFPQSRIQTFQPSSGKPTMKKIGNSVDDFILSVFNEDGSYNIDREYKATAGINRVNCKWCPYKTNYDLCPRENRVKNA